MRAPYGALRAIMSTCLFGSGWPMSSKFDHARRTVLRSVIGASAVTASGLPSSSLAARGSPVKVIDVHTHMYARGWQDVVRKANDPHIQLTTGPDGVDSMFYLWSSVGTLPDEMFDWELR